MALYLAYWLFPQKIQISDLRITDYLFRLRASRIQTHDLDTQEVFHVDAIFYADRSNLAHVIRNLAKLGVSAQLVDVVLADRIGEEEDQPLLDASLSAGNVYYGLSFRLRLRTANDWQGSFAHGHNPIHGPNEVAGDP